MGRDGQLPKSVFVQLHHSAPRKQRSGVVILLVITRFFTRKPPVMDLAKSDQLAVD